MRYRVVLPLLGAFALTMSACLTGAADAAQPVPTITGRVFPALPGAVRYYAVACAGTDTCFVAGQTKLTNGVGVLTRVTASSLGRPTQVAGTSSLVGIACPSVATCVAIGQGPGLTLTTAEVVLIQDGKPGKPEQLPGVFLFGIGCGTAASCWATGETAHLRHALFAHIVDGRVAHVSTLQGVAAVSFLPPWDIDPSVTPDPGPPPDCYSASACAVGTSTGNWENKGAGLVVWLDNGRVRGLLNVPGTPRVVVSRVAGLDCVSAGNCTAVTDNRYLIEGNAHLGQTGSVVTIREGRISQVASTVPIGKGVTSDFPTMTSMACDATTCFGSGGVTVILEIVGGHPVGRVGTHTFLNATACGTSSCAGIGYTAHRNTVAIVYAFS